MTVMFECIEMENGVIGWRGVCLKKRVQNNKTDTVASQTKSTTLKKSTLKTVQAYSYLTGNGMAVFSESLTEQDEPETMSLVKR